MVPGTCWASNGYGHSLLNFTGINSKAEIEASRTEEKKGAENGSESKSIYLVLANNYVQIEASHLHITVFA